MSDESQGRTREEWIQWMKQEGKQEVIRKEMIRLGFWVDKQLPPEEQKKVDEEEEELAQLQEELNQLRKESNKLGNIHQLIQAARQKRIKESKQRRAERKAIREQEQKEEEHRWKEYQDTHVVHAGKNVSKHLSDTALDADKLQKLGLPIVRSSLELATAMGITVSRLKWLTYHRKTATLSHYIHFTIPKRNGNPREISAPKPELRQAQEWIKREILDPLDVHPKAYGFVTGKSIVDNAQCHVNQAAVIKMDLKDFFPSITFHRVKGLFRSFGYSGLVSTLLALICTEPPRKKVEFGGKLYYVAIHERQLPQGACTSPSITNRICRQLDLHLDRIAESHQFTYTRYADDLTISCGPEALPKIGALINDARKRIQFEGFTLNEAKTRVLRANKRQTVTGLVVNEKTNISRQTLRNFRALLHNVEKNGLEAENREGHPNFFSYIQGYTQFIAMVRPDVGDKLQAQVERIGEKYGLLARREG